MNIFILLKFITNHPVNQNRKIEAILRFFKWQIGSRLVPGEVIYEWINGAKFQVRTGESGLTGNIYTGLHEFSDMAYLLHVLREEDLFIDVGANVGSYTILACAAIGAKGYAFEPIPKTYRRLVENIRLNHLEDQVKYFNQGVGEKKGILSFTSNSNCTNHVLASGEQRNDTINVEVLPLDVSLENQEPTLIKIDVEGFETPVLKGADKTLSAKTLHSVIMELNGSGCRYGFDESSIVRLMFDYGFKSYSYDPFSRTLTNLEGKSKTSGNTLFIREESLVKDRLRSATNFSVYGKKI